MTRSLKLINPSQIMQFVTGLLFVCALSGMPINSVQAGPDCSDPKHENKPACSGGGGQEYPTYDVTFGGDMDGSVGENWQSSQDQNGITYFLVDQQGGTGNMNLSYFRNPWADGGPFTEARGANCFNLSTPINAVQFYRDKDGSAVLKASFVGYSDNGLIDFMYLLTLKGVFDYPNDWLPQSSTAVTISSWKLKLKSKRENKLFSNITCTGDGTFATSIVVSRN